MSSRGSGVGAPGSGGSSGSDQNGSSRQPGPAAVQQLLQQLPLPPRQHQHQQQQQQQQHPLLLQQQRPPGLPCAARQQQAAYEEDLLLQQQQELLASAAAIMLAVRDGEADAAGPSTRSSSPHQAPGGGPAAGAGALPLHDLQQLQAAARAALWLLPSSRGGQGSNSGSPPGSSNQRQAQASQGSPEEQVLPSQEVMPSLVLASGGASGNGGQSEGTGTPPGPAGQEQEQEEQGQDRGQGQGQRSTHGRMAQDQGPSLPGDSMWDVARAPTLLQLQQQLLHVAGTQAGGGAAPPPPINWRKRASSEDGGAAMYAAAAAAAQQTQPRDQALGASMAWQALQGMQDMQEFGSQDARLMFAGASAAGQLPLFLPSQQGSAGRVHSCSSGGSSEQQQPTGHGWAQAGEGRGGADGALQALSALAEVAAAESAAVGAADAAAAAAAAAAARGTLGGADWREVVCSSPHHGSKRRHTLPLHARQPEFSWE